MVYYAAIGLMLLGGGTLLYTLASLVFQKNVTVEKAYSGKPVTGTNTQAQKPGKLTPVPRAGVETLLHRSKVESTPKGQSERIWFTSQSGNPGAVAREERAQTPSDQLLMGGILFLDHGRELPLQNGELRKSPLKLFQGLKRMGRGNLHIAGDSFRISTGHTEHRYNGADLEQLLFLRKGIALVPANRNLPVIVFITDDPTAVKEYIRRHALHRG